MKRQVTKKKRKNIKTNKHTCWLRYCMSRQLWLILTQHVQSGLLFLLSDHGQSGPVPRECCCLSLQESSLSADSWHKETWYIIKRLLANRIFLLPTSVPFFYLWSVQQDNNRVHLISLYLPTEQVWGWFQWCPVCCAYKSEADKENSSNKQTVLYF